MLAAGFWIIVGLLYIAHKYNTEEMNLSGPYSLLLIVGTITGFGLLCSALMWYDGLHQDVKDFFSTVVWIAGGVIAVILLIRHLKQSTMDEYLDCEVTEKRPAVEAQFLDRDASVEDYRLVDAYIRDHLKETKEHLPTKEAYNRMMKIR